MENSGGKAVFNSFLKKARNLMEFLKTKKSKKRKLIKLRREKNLKIKKGLQANY